MRATADPSLRIVKTPRGARVLHGPFVLSEVLSSPGPTHSIFDVLAGCLAVTSPEANRVAMLGFAGGGVLAPLRALGVRSEVCAVDLSTLGVSVFRRLSRRWAGKVEVEEAEASAWLRRQRRRFPAILEDLSQQIPGDVVKPEVSWTVLPALAARRLAKGGVVVTNVLPTPGLRLPRLLARLSAPHRSARVVSVEGFDNRILLAAGELPPAAQLQALLEQALRRLGSRLRRKIRVARGPAPSGV